MTMKYRHAFDDGIGEVQDHVNGAAIRNIHGIQPRRMRERPAPIANRTAISRLRTVARVSSRFAALPQAIISTRPANTIRTVAARETTGRVLSFIDASAIEATCA